MKRKSDAADGIVLAVLIGALIWITVARVTGVL